MLNVNDVNQIYLGCQGENLARTIIIDVKPWLVAYPGGTVAIWHKRNGAEEATATGAVFDSEAGTITWRPTGTDTYVFGEGEAEIRLTVGNVIKKSRKITTDVAKAVTGADGEALVSGWQGYLDAIQRAAGVAITKNGLIQFAVNAAGHLILSYTEDVPIPAEESDETTEEGDIVWIDKDLGKVTPSDEQVQEAANTYLETVITNPDSPPLDRSLSSNVSAAPADMVGDLKLALTQIEDITISTDSKIDIGSLSKGSYIKPADGTTGSTGSACKTGYVDLAVPVMVTMLFDRTVYEYNIYGYGSHSVSSAVHSFTGGAWISDNRVLIIPDSGITCVIISIIRKDRTTITTEEVTTLKSNIKITKAVDVSIALQNVAGAIVSSSNYTDYFSSINAIDKNGWYYLSSPQSIDNNFPTSKNSILFSYRISSAINWQFVFETGDYPSTYARYYANGSWSAWRKAGDNIEQFFRNIAGTTVTTSNYTTYFSNFNSISSSGWFYITSPQSIDVTSPTNKNCLLLNNLINGSTGWQFIAETGDNPKLFVRYKITNTWGSWRTFYDIPRRFVVDVNGSGDFASLASCLVYINENSIKNADVYIKPGTYNIYDEMKAEFGDNYWTTFNTSTTRYYYGLPMTDGIHIHGDNGVILACENDQTSAEAYFAFFYTYNVHDAIIENIKMVGKRIRYCVHVEYSTSAGNGTVVVRNCSMHINNSESTNWHHAAGIGAGSGLYTNCIFENNDIHPVFDAHVEKKSAILWHNTAGNNPSNKVIITGNYCDGDSVISVATNGTSTNKCPCVISNNSMGGELLYINNQNDNLNVMAWNNIVRS